MLTVFLFKDMRDCPLTGWRRILARNSDSDGGWGFNFIAPNGYRLNRYLLFFVSGVCIFQLIVENKQPLLLKINTPYLN